MCSSDLEFALGPPAQSRVAEWLDGRGIGDAPLAALAPGAAHATKRWPATHWDQLAALLRAAGMAPVLLGGPGDRSLGAELAGTAVSAVGEFSLQETGALLARARVLVSNDTGVMHMATGVGTPVVALFGPTVAAFGFFPYNARATVLQRDLDCRPCSAMGSARCPMGHHRCLVDISPADVMTAVAPVIPFQPSPASRS